MGSKTRKIILFLVEGYFDEMTLYGVIKNLISRKYSNQVRFYAARCDITSDINSNSANIITKVNKYVKYFLDENKLKKSDICSIIHLVDIDGAYIEKIFILEADVDKIMYSRNGIKCRNIGSISERNYRKSLNLNTLIGTNNISKVPYELYYFSTDLEDVFHNKLNCTNEEKLELADEFDNLYQDNIDEFIKLCNNREVFLGLPYKESWEYIKKDLNSLRRCSNFDIFINKHNDDEDNGFS